MRMKTKSLKFITLAFVLVLASCDNDLSKTSLKDSLNDNVNTLDDAIKKINASSEFQLLTQSEASSSNEILKAPSTGIGDFMPNDTVLITLDKISGVYEYSWKRVKDNKPYFRFFTRTSDSEFMIVRLPLKKVRNPLSLFWFQIADTTLKNNFEAKVSDYYVMRNRVIGNEYRLKSDFSIDNEKIGMLTELRSRNKVNGFNASSIYELASGYTVSRTENSGDTAISAYAISKEGKILYEEKLTTVKVFDKNFKYRERTYSLTIGNVQIVRNKQQNVTDSAKVYLNGILQTSAKVEIIVNQPDSTDQNVTFAKRDIKITFDDGSSTTLRTLMGENIAAIGEIFKTVRQTNFATNIIDRIAWNIYIRKQ
jgi:hypothetical protein